jgi:ARG and Rhodanese-Phosphatase-superfamily-associated Protein domain
MKSTMMMMMVVGVLASGAWAQPAKDAPAPGTLEQMLDRVEVVQGREYGAITLYPLVLKKAETSKDALRLEVFSHVAKLSRVSFHESTAPGRQWLVQISASTPRPVLVPAGTILTGGRLDRMIPQDLIVTPGTTVAVRTVPAEYVRDQRRGAAIKMRMDASAKIAPAYLRVQAALGAGTDLVPGFVSRFLTYRAKGEKHRSLEAVGASPTLDASIRTYVQAFATLPKLYEKRVVGWVAVVGGRVHGLDIYGTNALAAAQFAADLRAYVFPLTAMTARAVELGIVMPDPGALANAERFRPDVNVFLARLRAADRVTYAAPRGTHGETARLRKQRVRAAVLTMDGRLVHAGAVADVIFLEKLYDRVLPAPVVPGTEPTAGALDRRDLTANRRLSEYEERLLARMRERRSRR